MLNQYVDVVYVAMSNTETSALRTNMSMTSLDYKSVSSADPAPLLSVVKPSFSSVIVVTDISISFILRY